MSAPHEEDKMIGLTKDCPRNDCRLTVGMSSTTLLGWSPVYDKHGDRIDSDPNWTTVEYRCARCKVAWKVRTREGSEPEISRFEPEPAVVK